MAEEYGGKCLECGATYRGRSNRKFCSDRCRRKAGKRREKLAALESEREHLLRILEWQKRDGAAMNVRYVAARLSRVTAMILKTSPESSPESSLPDDGPSS